MLPLPTPTIFAAFEFSSKLFRLLRFPSAMTEPDTEVGGEEDGDPGDPKNRKCIIKTFILINPVRISNLTF